MIVKIGDVISEYSVRNKFDENIPVYSVTNEKGFCTGYFSKEVASKDKSTYKIVPRGYFAYNPSRINVGSVDWQKYEDRVIVSPLYVVFGVSDRLDRQYLLHYLKSDMMLSFIKEYATGSVRDNLKLADLGKFPVNLRPVEEQRQIAATLDKIDELIAKRRQQLNKLDELVKSRFIEMFGDLADPACDWPQSKLTEICADPDGIKCGPFGTQLNKAEYRNEGVALWEIPQINAQFKVEPIHYLDFDKATELDAYSIIPGDIAMSRKGNVGQCAVFPCDYMPGIIHSDVLRIRVDSGKMVPIFMMYQLHYSGTVKRQIEQVSSGAIMAGINVTKLKFIMVHLPPMELQEQFAAFVAQTDKSKSFDDLEVAA